MILTDANLLLYAYNLDAAEHGTSRQWLETQLSGPNLFCFAWQTVTAFLRISTNQRAFAAPLSTKEATGIVTEWAGAPADGTSHTGREALGHLPETNGVGADERAVGHGRPPGRTGHRAWRHASLQRSRLLAIFGTEADQSAARLSFRGANRGKSTSIGGAVPPSFRFTRSIAKISKDHGLADRLYR